MSQEAVESRKNFNELHFLRILELKRATKSWRGRTEETLDAGRLREHPNAGVDDDSDDHVRCLFRKSASDVASCL